MGNTARMARNCGVNPTESVDYDDPIKRNSPSKRTTVVNIRLGEEFDVYIGRGRKGGQGSPWGNPYILGKHGNRAQCIASYLNYILSTPSLMRILPSLQGKKLGCFCVPMPCHGEVLAELANALTDGATIEELMANNGRVKLTDAVYK